MDDDEDDDEAFLSSVQNQNKLVCVRALNVLCKEADLMPPQTFLLQTPTSVSASNLLDRILQVRLHRRRKAQHFSQKAVHSMETGHS